MLKKIDKIKSLKSFLGKNYLITYSIIPLCIAFFAFPVDYENKVLNLKQYYTSVVKLIQNTFDFKVEKIIFSGLNNLNENLLMNHTDLKYNSSIFKIDLKSLHTKFMEIELISEVKIEREIPDTIKIYVKEKIPVGFVQKNDKYKIITKDGSIISKTKINDSSNLPIFVGKNSEKMANKILNVLNLVNFNQEIWSISLVQERRWNLNLKKGITILLPEKEIKKALIKLKNLHNLYNILDGDFVEIDLRNNDKFILQPLIKLNQNS